MNRLILLLSVIGMMAAAFAVPMGTVQAQPGLFPSGAGNWEQTGDRIKPKAGIGRVDVGPAHAIYPQWLWAQSARIDSLFATRLNVGISNGLRGFNLGTGMTMPKDSVIEAGPVITPVLVIDTTGYVQTDSLTFHVVTVRHPKTVSNTSISTYASRRGYIEIEALWTRGEMATNPLTFLIVSDTSNGVFIEYAEAVTVGGSKHGTTYSARTEASIQEWGGWTVQENDPAGTYAGLYSPSIVRDPNNVYASTGRIPLQISATNAAATGTTTFKLWFYVSDPANPHPVTTGSGWSDWWVKLAED